LPFVFGGGIGSAEGGDGYVEEGGVLVILALGVGEVGRKGYFAKGETRGGFAHGEAVGFGSFAGEDVAGEGDGGVDSNGAHGVHVADGGFDAGSSNEGRGFGLRCCDVDFVELFGVFRPFNA